MTVIQKHSKTFYGRPRQQLTTLLDHTVRGIARTEKRKEELTDKYLVVLAKLTAEERRTMLRYQEQQLALEGLKTFKLALDWMLGAGLDARSFTKQFTVLWGEEITYPYELPER